MSFTAGELVTEVQGLLNSWSLDEEQATTLSANIGATDSSFVVTQPRGVATGISPGIVEIGSELLYCDTVSAQNGTVTITPWGRGYLNTTAAAHSAGARVVSQPTYPRAWVLKAINETIERVFPDLFCVKSYEDTTKLPQVTYDTPDDLEWVLNAKWLLPDGTKRWKAIKSWRVSPGLGTQFGDGLNGITVDIDDFVIPGRPIQFLYAAAPSALQSESDDFVTVTGLHTGARDVIALGAAAKMTVSQELSRLQTSSIEQQDRSRLVAPSAALTSSRVLEQSFQTRLMEERQNLQRLYPPRMVRTYP